MLISSAATSYRVRNLRPHRAASPRGDVDETSTRKTGHHHRVRELLSPRRLAFTGWAVKHVEGSNPACRAHRERSASRARLSSTTSSSPRGAAATRTTSTGRVGVSRALVGRDGHVLQTSVPRIWASATALRMQFTPSALEAINSCATCLPGKSASLHALPPGALHRPEVVYRGGAAREARSSTGTRATFQSDGDFDAPSSTVLRPA